MMQNRKKIIFAALSVLVVALGAAGVYGLVYLNKSSMERAIANGVEAENRGDTEQALAEYKYAAEKCPVNDDRCRNDMETKVKLMTEILKSEQADKTGDPVQGAENIPFEDTAPEDRGFVEKS